MSQLKICRICLRTEAKMFKMNMYGLQWYYEKVLAFKVDNADRLPQYFCYECSTLLHKYHNFKEKCYMGQKILKNMIEEGQITYETIYKVDRKKFNLISSLDMIQNTKVGTIFTVVHKDFTQKNENKNENATINTTVTKDNVKVEVEIEHVAVDLEKVFCKSEVLIKTEQNDKTSLPQEDNSTDSDDNDYLDIDDVTTESVNIESKNTKQPTGVFIVADKNQDVTVRKLRASQIKKSKYSHTTKSKSNKKGAWKLEELMKEGNWKMTTMSEDESLQTFRAKSQCDKYTSAKNKCTDCFIFFSNNEMYTRHRLRWHTKLNNPYECRFCKQRFRVNSQIKKHLKSHYTKFECLRCNLVCWRESTIIAHDAYHKGKIWRCQHCNEEFRHQSTYYTHIRTAHRSKYLCNLCGRSFLNELGMRQHKLRKHLDQPAGSQETSDVDKDIKTFCSTCDIRFETEQAYNEHKLHSSKHIDIIIPERKIKRKIPTECPQCGKEFGSQAACSKHCKTEHPDHKFVPYPELQRRHVCELCGATVLFKNLKIHLMNIHEKKNVCYCNICGKKFSSGGALKIHSVVHTGEKPHKCTLCDKRFTQKCSMKLHYRTFHLKEPYPKRSRNKVYLQPTRRNRNNDEIEPVNNNNGRDNAIILCYQCK